MLAVLSVVALAATGTAVGVALPSAAGAAGTVTYTSTQTFPVPPASSYAGSGGGDGWGLAFSATQVFNVFHHDSSLTVACHEQADASSCYSPETITDPASGAGFTVGGHAGLWMDAGTGKLYVFATRTDATAGVVCIDTTQAATSTDPFCGFTPLTTIGSADLSPGYSSLSDTMQVGPRLYAFNYAASHALPDGDFNTLLCFDTTTHAACAGQPYTVNLGSGNLTSGTAPGPGVAAIGGKVIVTAQVDGTTAAAGCFDPATSGTCAGSWPVTSVPLSYPGTNGAPFPLLSATGALSGFCLPTGPDQCWNMSGAAVPTPAGLSGAVGGTSPYNGQAVVLGPRVYVPNGNNDEVDCFDSSTGASCTQFPHPVSALGAGYMYTVTADPARPTCIWVNSDNGQGQIQNFDAYTGGACGQGPIRVLASSFVVDTQLCQPASYTSLQITSPAPNSYTSGTVNFEDADASPLPGLPTVSLDSTGTATLTGLNLTTAYSLPQFLITLTGASSTPTSVTATLTWTGTDDSTCVKPGTTVSGGGLNYVAVGDSYSSGEGNPPFLNGTDTASDQCHRSPEAYTEDLADDPTLNITSYTDRACSGATSSELEFGFPANHEDAQVSHISGSTNLITIGVGGDDVGFADVLSWCIVGLHTGASSDCQHMKVPDPDSGTKVTLTQRESTLINRLGEDLFCETPNGYVDCQPSLHSIYEDIASRAAVNARILVLLYPHLFTNAPASSGCNLSGVGGFIARISKVNMTWINQGVDQLDSKIISEVQLAKKGGINIDYVDPRPAWADTDNNASPGGHGVCTKEPWINGLMLKGLGPSVYSFHPNILGQFEFYTAIRGKLLS